MTTVLLLLLSVVLIGSGVGLIWRDLHGRRRDEVTLARDQKVDPEVQPNGEIRASQAAATVVLAAQPAAPRPSLASKILNIALGGGLGAEEPANESLLRPDAARPSATAQQWAALQPVISTAVEQVNAVLAGAGVAIGTSNEPSWGDNKAYGADRRILVGGQSLASLRLECTAGGRLFAMVKAHDGVATEINSDASAPAAGLNIGRVSDLLSECLKALTAYAVRTKGDVEQMASETAWKAIEGVVIAALKAGNGALSQAGARLMPLATPAWDAELRHHRMPVAVQVFGNDIARMHIDRLDQEIEVAVGLPEAHLANLGRRERMPVEGMTMHALAEMIAGCAWPAIERYRETRQLA